MWPPDNNTGHVCVCVCMCRCVGVDVHVVYGVRGCVSLSVSGVCFVVCVCVYVYCVCGVCCVWHSYTHVYGVYLYIAAGLYTCVHVHVYGYACDYIQQNCDKDIQ